MKNTSEPAKNEEIQLVLFFRKTEFENENNCRCIDKFLTGNHEGRTDLTRGPEQTDPLKRVYPPFSPSPARFHAQWLVEHRRRPNTPGNTRIPSGSGLTPPIGVGQNVASTQDDIRNHVTCQLLRRSDSNKLYIYIYIYI